MLLAGRVVTAVGVVVVKVLPPEVMVAGTSEDSVTEPVAAALALPLVEKIVLSPMVEVMVEPPEIISEIMAEVEMAMGTPTTGAMEPMVEVIVESLLVMVVKSCVVVSPIEDRADETEPDAEPTASEAEETAEETAPLAPAVLVGGEVARTVVTGEVVGLAVALAMPVPVTTTPAAAQ